MAGVTYGLLASVQHELMLFAMTCFLVFAADDLAIDIMWMVRRAYRRFGIYRRFQRATAMSLPQPVKPPRFALFVAAWRESPVIGNVLESAIRAYAGHDVTIFVGCYGNDPATRAIVQRFSGHGVIAVLNGAEGPTTKADNLNAIWRGLRSVETETRRFDGIIIHDAEDEIDPHEILIFSALHNRFSAIHLPVIPTALRDTRWVGNHYCDEFAEAHIKAQVVREALGAALPSAGVGCMLRRDLLDALDGERAGAPFEASSLTEDYELGLTAKRLGLSSAFIRMRCTTGGLTVATRARFPKDFDAAVRQKARWIAGIAIAGWDRTGWGGGTAEVWMRLRDRKSLISALAVCAGYASLTLWCLLLPQRGTAIGEAPVLATPVIAGLVLSSILLVWRLAIRCACVTYTYGLQEGLLSIPRAVICNVIAVAASVRAVRSYVAMTRSGRVHWDKTEHFPVNPVGP